MLFLFMVTVKYMTKGVVLLLPGCCKRGEGLVSIIIVVISIILITIHSFL